MKAKVLLAIIALSYVPAVAIGRKHDGRVYFCAPFGHAGSAISRLCGPRFPDNVAISWIHCRSLNM